MLVKKFSYRVAALMLMAGAFQAGAANTPNERSEQNEYVARLADCSACHTYSVEYAGAVPFATPLGTVYSANITPDKKTGIGEYTYEEFDQVIRHGTSRSGRVINPAMPYPAYSKITDADLRAIYDFLMQDLKPVENQVKKPEGESQDALKAWREKHAPTVEVWQPAQGMNERVARGAYIVETLGHCGYCHSPRGEDGQEVAMSNDSEKRFLSGAVYDNWLALNLRNDNKDGIGDWTEEEFVTLLKTGRNHRTAVFGGMATVVQHSTQYMTNEDLAAVFHYLKSLEPKEQSPAYQYDNATGEAIVRGDISKTGAANYVDRCNACHQSNGKGYSGVFPALAGNSVVRSDDVTSLVHIVLAGFTVPATEKAPSTFTMPPFAGQLTDQEVADVVNFIRSSWNNGAPENATAEDAAKLRSE